MHFAWFISPVYIPSRLESGLNRLTSRNLLPRLERCMLFLLKPPFLRDAIWRWQIDIFRIPCHDHGRDGFC